MENRTLGKPGKKSLSTVMMLAVLLLAMFIVLTLLTDKFLTVNNIQNLLRQTAIYGVIAIGMTFVIMSGGIDLSVGAVVGLSGVLSAMFMSTSERTGGMGLPVWLAIIAAVAISSLVGVINGAIIFDGKVPPFIATLGIQTAVRGLIMLITNAQMISGIPKDFAGFSRQTFLAFPTLGWVWVAFIVVAAIVIKFTTFGRNIFAVGSNTEAARLSGISIRKTTYSVYVVSALMCAVAGVHAAWAMACPPAASATRRTPSPRPSSAAPRSMARRAASSARCWARSSWPRCATAATCWASTRSFWRLPLAC